jgi:hypothetical protein
MMPGMTDSARVAKPLRVLVSEGNSTSAREAITILGLSGHHIEVCDPSPLCLAKFSRFVSKVHQCPGLRDDPAGFLGFVEKLLVARHFDVLLPIHEQGFLFARVGPRLAVPTAVLTTAGNRIASRSSFSHFTIRVAGCGRPNRSSSRLNEALLCAVR